MVTTIIILSILLLLSIYGNFNVLRKLSKLENIILIFQYKENDLSNLINNANLKIRELDTKGAFESDDEVGFFFKYIKEIQNILNSKDGEEK